MTTTVRLGSVCDLAVMTGRMKEMLTETKGVNIQLILTFFEGPAKFAARLERMIVRFREANAQEIADIRLTFETNFAALEVFQFLVMNVKIIDDGMYH
jgi:hypothetical protein